eukprot:TRINITY_DN71075_c0_g1_i1.p1 TRINITY_DN71075_c0_g1~~TRINITY_DN71075_c0_g1_i1.p1  ORF type:complete len:560 (+),score=108.00 TRINITY_DN71075_c0_g1_i1:75-1682(+)
MALRRGADLLRVHLEEGCRRGRLQRLEGFERRATERKGWLCAHRLQSGAICRCCCPPEAAPPQAAESPPAEQQGLPAARPEGAPGQPGSGLRRVWQSVRSYRYGLALVVRSVTGAGSPRRHGRRDWTETIFMSTSPRGASGAERPLRSPCSSPVSCRSSAPVGPAGKAPEEERDVGGDDRDWEEADEVSDGETGGLALSVLVRLAGAQRAPNLAAVRYAAAEELERPLLFAHSAAAAAGMQCPALAACAAAAQAPSSAPHLAMLAADRGSSAQVQGLAWLADVASSLSSTPPPSPPPTTARDPPAAVQRGGRVTFGLRWLCGVAECEGTGVPQNLAGLCAAANPRDLIGVLAMRHAPHLPPLEAVAAGPLERPNTATAPAPAAPPPSSPPPPRPRPRGCGALGRLRVLAAEEPYIPSDTDGMSPDGARWQYRVAAARARQDCAAAVLQAQWRRRAEAAAAGERSGLLQRALAARRGAAVAEENARERLRRRAEQQRARAAVLHGALRRNAGGVKAPLPSAATTANAAEAAAADAL